MEGGRGGGNGRAGGCRLRRTWREIIHAWRFPLCGDGSLPVQINVQHLRHRRTDTETEWDQVPPQVLMNCAMMKRHSSAH